MYFKDFPSIYLNSNGKKWYILKGDLSIMTLILIAILKIYKRTIIIVLTHFKNIFLEFILAIPSSYYFFIIKTSLDYLSN